MLSVPLPSPPVPTISAGCQLYTAPEIGAAPSAILETYAQDITVTPVCQGSLRRISIQKGNHLIGSGAYQATHTPTGYTGTYRVRAGYWMQSILGGQAGVVALSGGSAYATFYTTPNSTGSDTDQILYQTDGMTPLLIGPSPSGQHDLEMSRTYSMTSSYQLVIGTGNGTSATENSPNTTLSDVPGFFAGNEDAQNDNDALDVYLAWIEICSP